MEGSRKRPFDLTDDNVKDELDFLTYEDLKQRVRELTGLSSQISKLQDKVNILSSYDANAAAVEVLVTNDSLEEQVKMQDDQLKAKEKEVETAMEDAVTYQNMWNEWADRKDGVDVDWAEFNKDESNMEMEGDREKLLPTIEGLRGAIARLRMESEARGEENVEVEIEVRLAKKGGIVVKKEIKEEPMD